MKYIIFTRQISNMGGAQLFVLRRARHLMQKGYEVYIVVVFHQDYFPMKDKFQGIPFFVVPETGQRAAKCKKTQQDTIVNDIIDKVGPGDSYFVESHTLAAVEWGELFSEKCHARHLAYPLTETKISTHKFQPGLRIFKEKLSKNEFYGCFSTALNFIFETDKVPNNYINVGYDETELTEKSQPLICFSRKEGEYVISTVSRFDKTYIEPLVEATVELAKKYQEQKFVLLLGGGSPNKEREKYLKENYNNRKYDLKNLDIKYLGYIDKLGNDFFCMTSVFVGMATASINAISQRCITINIDPRYGMQKASGFFGIDTNNFAYSENGKVFSILEKIEEAYLFTEEQKERVRNAGRKLYENEFEMNTCFEKMDKVINSFEPVKYRKSLEVSDMYRFFVRVLFGIKNVIKRA